MNQSVMGATRTMRHVSDPFVVFVFLLVSGGSGAEALGCPAPPRPFAPSDPEAARAYADLIRTDFETYLSEVQTNFRSTPPETSVC